MCAFTATRSRRPSDANQNLTDRILIIVIGIEKNIMLTVYIRFTALVYI